MTLSVVAFLAVVLAAGERATETTSTETKLRAGTKTETKSERKGETPQVAAPRLEDRTAHDRTSGPGQRLREGSEIGDQLGQFRDTGGRIVFQARDSELSLQVLENLALERISRVLEEARPVRMWSVSGVITEYRGANYLLVTRAVLTAKETAEPAPQTTSQPPLANQKPNGDGE